MDIDLITKALEATVSHGMTGHIEAGPILCIIKVNYVLQPQ